MDKQLLLLSLKNCPKKKLIIVVFLFVAIALHPNILLLNNFTTNVVRYNSQKISL